MATLGMARGDMIATKVARSMLRLRLPQTEKRRGNISADDSRSQSR